MDGWLVAMRARSVDIRARLSLVILRGCCSHRACPASQPASHPKPRGPDPCALLAVDGRGPPHRPSASRSGLIAPGQGADATQARMPGPPHSVIWGRADDELDEAISTVIRATRRWLTSGDGPAWAGSRAAGLVCFWLTVPGSTQWTDGSSGAVMRAHSGGHSAPLKPPGTLHKLRWRRPASHLGMW